MKIRRVIRKSLAPRPMGLCFLDLHHRVCVFCVEPNLLSVERVIYNCDIDAKTHVAVHACVAQEKDRRD